MKRLIHHTVLSVFLVVNINCSNDNDPPPPPDNDLVSVTIKEYKTNLPVEGATFGTYICSYYDFQFGCTQSVIYSSCITNSLGKCNYKLPDKDFRAITVEKQGYWRTYSRYIFDEFFIQPEAWVTINFETDTAYPETSYFFITVIGENTGSMNYIPEVEASVKTITLYGNENNKIKWVLYETYNASSAILNSGNIELQPEKFENLSYTLNY